MEFDGYNSKLLSKLVIKKRFGFFFKFLAAQSSSTSLVVGPSVRLLVGKGLWKSDLKNTKLLLKHTYLPRNVIVVREVAVVTKKLSSQFFLKIFFFSHFFQSISP